ncbi:MULTISPECIES: ATP-grasp domain-containing protein [unclassified Streptomyces]|uniref:ATP-grasp domain-containing protein n=1 Tax=unclassified Streptomyces TaxID=2593676 RepID=UPI00202EFB2E|nr:MULTISPECIES: ATP-grasp domain-containing protein [unclassified Streptomyces]MCM1965150.1 ATP-grasp domain-containing protein [Streptomyces sp. G1]MCX5128260.1 ATP-grasp domain-containing protein [Streptomyces sp. NBC_00347]MCX5300846.1 ATP-grasp domain-containing protein [Streptomyces sp. NBC_00193]
MTLLLPPRVTPSAARLREAAHARGLATVQLEGFAVPEGLRAGHLHAGPRFADAVAPGLGIGLLEAPSDWLARLPREFTGREVRLMPIREAYGLRRPVFVKSPNDKEIPALVYADGSRLPGPDAVDPGTEVLVSDVVRFTAEYRVFLLDGTVHTASRYAEDGRLSLGPASAGALAFAAGLPFSTLPSAIVVDVGLAGGRWSVIEANAAWASGTYVCDPDRALDVALRAAAPLPSFADRDRRFLR